MQKCWNERRTNYVKRRNRRNEEESNACEINENTIGPPSPYKISKTRKATIWVRGTILTVITIIRIPDRKTRNNLEICFFPMKLQIRTQNCFTTQSTLPALVVTISS